MVIWGEPTVQLKKKFEQPNGESKLMNVELFTWEKLDLVPAIKTAFNL
jgi:S-adenosylmethionine synthetase